MFSTRFAVCASGMLLALTLGCGSTEDPVGAPVGPASGGSAAPTAGTAAGGAPAAEPMTQPGCKAPADAPSTPRSIAEVVTLLNALPKPTSVSCLIEALAQPLAVQAANSVLSAQPADGARSPRIFLFFDPLVLSVVPAGDGVRLVEFGERRGDGVSLKAELEFPIDHTLSATAPFDRLKFNEQTSTSTCGFCHRSETPAEEVPHPFARLSQAMRPMPSQRVSVATLQNEAASCDRALEPERCEMLRAIFSRAQPAIERDFPTSYKTFF